jgi:hypothetical protein
VSKRLIISGIPAGRATSFTVFVCDCAGDGDANAKPEKLTSKMIMIKAIFFILTPPQLNFFHITLTQFTTHEVQDQNCTSEYENR